MLALQGTDWEGVLNRWGLPILLLLVVGWAVWKLARWIAPRIDRIVDSHVKFVDSLDQRVGKLEDGGEEAIRLLRSIDQKVTR
jgi:hypothetical protein